jgi:hypothetical protein
MSTYAVFGMARHRAVTKARDALKPTHSESASEFEARVQLKAGEIMDGPETTQLSEKFDAPHFADEFFAIAKRDGARRLHIRVHCLKAIDKATNKKSYHWVNITDAEGLERSRRASAGEIA